jgi:hypothetical protein
MAAPYKLSEILHALDPIPEWRPKGLREVNRRLRWERGWQGTGPLSARSLLRTVGGSTLLQAFQAIDSGNPPKSLRRAYEKLKFPLGGGVTRVPPGPVSLREIARRIQGPRGVRLRFLSYNTYLLPGGSIPFGRWIDETVGWDALAWFGIPFGPGLLAYFGLVPFPGVVVAVALEAAGFKPSKVIEAITGIDLDTVASKGAKPALLDRARFLGPTLGVYDVCCLCEVFTDEARQVIRAGIEQTNAGPPFAATAGPDESGSWTLAGSGLFFLAKRAWPIVKTERLIFENRGGKRKDTDAWANKGILLNVLDLGFGRLELFQTHLYYGNDIPKILLFTDRPTDQERLAVQRDELAEIADFYRHHHRPENVALVTGDFNMGGGDVRHYAEIRRTMDSLNLRDLWAWDVYRNNPSEGNTCRFTDGEDRNDWEREFQESAAPNPKGANVCLRQKQPGASAQWQDYCDDRSFHPPPHRGVGRYDYIFVEQPTAAHRYTLEVSRLLRRPFPLINLEYEGETYLSDHLGLELTLYCSPRGTP